MSGNRYREREACGVPQKKGIGVKQSGGGVKFYRKKKVEQASTRHAESGRERPEFIFNVSCWGRGDQGKGKDCVRALEVGDELGSGGGEAGVKKTGTKSGKTPLLVRDGEDIILLGERPVRGRRPWVGQGEGIRVRNRHGT